MINLIGLSTGLACALLIYLWVNDELHVDKFHANDGRLYQVLKNSASADGKILTFEWTPGPLADALTSEMPEVEYAVPVQSSFSSKEGILSAGDQHIKAMEKYAGESFFNVFSYPIIQGEKSQALQDKNAMLISDELAAKLFPGTDNVIGKTVEWKKEKFGGIFCISGVFQKPPLNSTFQSDLLFSYKLCREIEPNVDSWESGNPRTYVLMKKGSDIDYFNEKIRSFIGEKSDDKTSTLFTRRYSDKYLYDHYENGVQSGGRIVYVRLFSVIALFILAIACINFINLSTARASTRLKEVGIKKAIGADRKTLILQFLGESLILVFLSLTVATVLVEALLPQFNVLTGKHLGKFDFNLIVSIIVLALFTGLLSGSYPAFYLSGFAPATVLKKKLNTSIAELWIRKGLVICQFFISVILIVSVLVVYKQIAFIQSKNLGFDKDNIISFKKEGRLEEHLETFLHEIKNIPGVINASNYHPDLTVNHTGTNWVNWPGKEAQNNVSFKYLFAGYDFLETLGIELKEGRSFSREFSTDNAKIIFNETAIKSMGLSNPVGQTINLWGENKEIVGVVRDFHFESLYENLKPCFLLFSPNEDNIIVKIKAGAEKAVIAQIQKFYNEFNQGLPFDFKFLDDDYQTLYESEMRIGTLAGYFAGLAILVSCLGLFGLSTYSAKRRTKEIGVRKVLGSSVPRIIVLLSGEFTKIVLASMIISLPVSYFITTYWLGSFAYRINLQAWYFVGAGLVTLFVAWLTIGAQAIRAATAKPVEALRYE
jgi:putative ABC transport system permease protein